MNWGYREPELLAAKDSLLQIVIDYLHSKGWYFDHDHYREVWEESAGPRGIREAACWTVPQWDAYWRMPYDDDPKHANYGAPRTRRYETLKDAIWSQILREQEPAQFETFFK